MTELGTATPMDRQRTCIDYSKDGHLVGVDCGHWHEDHICLFDLTTKHRLCYAYPNCRNRLRKTPRRQVSGRVWIYGDLVAIRVVVE